MKFSKIVLLFFVILFLLGSTHAETLNLVENPSFESDKDSDEKPDCWDLITNYPNVYSFDEGLVGDTSLKMKTYCHPSKPTINYTVGSGGVCQNLDVKPDTTYTLSYYLKTDTPEKVQALPNTWEYDSEGNQIGQHYQYIDLDSNEKRIEFTFTTFSNTAWMRLCTRIWAHYDELYFGPPREGVFYTSWMDGIQLEEADTATSFHVDFNDCTDDDNDGMTEKQGDCDDADDTVYEGAPELCDEKDNNCNTETDEAICGQETDFDCDHVNDCSDDKCLGTVLPESIPQIRLFPRHYADVDADKIFETGKRYRRDYKVIDSEYTLTNTYGCSCEQILELYKPGKNEWEYKFGCTFITLKKWINQTLPL